MDDRLRAQFVVGTTPRETWERLVAAQPEARTGGAWWLPGFEAVVDAMEVRGADLHHASARA